MKKLFKRGFGFLLAMLMMVSLLPTAASAEEQSVQPEVLAEEQVILQEQPVEEQALLQELPVEEQVELQAVNPAKVNEAVTKFTDALSKFYQDTSKMSGLSAFLTRCGGVNTAASGVIGVLQMCGVIKDPTNVALGEILNTVKDIQTKLDQMDKKLDTISQQILSIAVAQEEKDRSNKATNMLEQWNSFHTNYTEPLDKRISQYQSKINSGIKAWWEQSEHDGIRALYTSHTVPVWNETFGAYYDHYVYDLTYANVPYSEGFPSAADNGESIDRSVSMSVSKELVDKTINDTGMAKFSINDYRAAFEEKMAANLIEAMDAKVAALLNGQTEENPPVEVNLFYLAQWTSFSDATKQQKAAEYAADILNTQIYHIACDVMSNNDDWVTDVISEYKNYCANILKQNSGVNAMLNAMYLTHGFEGEIKGDINDFIDSVVAQAGVYGQFALTCAGQDDLQSTDNRLAVQELFADTVNSLSDRKAKALTGFDNYCYITGTLVKQSTVQAKAAAYVKSREMAYKECKVEDWSITVPNILNNVYSQVLYRQYQTLNQGKNSFADYLHAYGAFNSNNNTTLMTRYGGASTFAFSEGIRMRADRLYSDCKYFKNGQYSNIDVGTGKKVEQKYYRVHDKILYDAFDMNAGTLEVNKLGGARAVYGESHWNWAADETWLFVTNYLPGWSWGDGSRQDGKYTWNDFICKVNFTVLELEPIHDLNGDNADPENPFFAFDEVSLTEGVSDVMGPVVMDSATALGSAKLSSSTFTYTGKAIKPKVTVKAGGKTVPKSGYTVSYMDNKAVGIASVTIKGKGKYSGTIHKTFRIIPKGTAIKKLTRSKTKTAVTVKWKAQSAKMTKSRIAGYQIRYSTKASMANAKKVTVNGYKKTSKVLRGLNKNKKYYVQIRTFMKVGGKKIYSSWSKTKAVK